MNMKETPEAKFEQAFGQDPLQNSNVHSIYISLSINCECVGHHLCNSRLVARNEWHH
jgi:hypothetical protein